ncbi:hypothetical protein IFM89_037912 [Coptis chinensis]|uniref:Uncharacterized protein n=1 Tax=Coptis chinensis TaxID=261450 RepID=A0A835M2X3_9MAGN|nr:hypothetical protein IFM89_037912 [Coptis chinensis]
MSIGGGPTTIVLHGGADQFIEEVEQSLHDAIMIVRRALKNSTVVAGGGAIDVWTDARYISVAILARRTQKFSPLEDETIFVGDDRVPLEGVIQFDKPDFSEKINKWGRVALLSGGDVMALLLFSAIGRLSHGFPVLDVETLHTAYPFIAKWFLSAYFLGGYGSDGTGMEGLLKAVTTAAKSWAVGIPETIGHVNFNHCCFCYRFYKSLSPISKAYGTICFLATAAFQLGIYNPFHIALIHELVFSRFQV